MKECSICKEIKELDEFYSQKKYSKKREEYVYYQPYCKECAKDKVMKSNRNIELSREITRRWLKNNRDSVRRLNANYRNSGKYREWQRENKDKIKKYNEKRQHKNHDITQEEWTSCKAYFKYSCAYCGVSEEEHRDLYKQDLHREHVNHEGVNDLSNCVPSCKPCNSSKGELSMEYWYKERSERFSQERLDKIYKWLDEDYLKYLKAIEKSS